MPEELQAATQESATVSEPENTVDVPAEKEESAIGPAEIIGALWDRDEHGQNLTTITFTLELLDTLTGNVTKTISTLTTREPLASFTDVNGYASILITYKYSTATDFSRMLTILDDFAREMTDFQYGKHEDAYVPRLGVTIRPMSLRGTSIIAVNPIYHGIQPHDPMYAECNELKLLFIPDTVGFYFDPNSDDEAISDQVRAEIAAEESIRTAAERKKAEEEAYRAEREREAKARMDQDYNLNGGHVIKEVYHGFGKDRDKESDS